MVDSQHIIEKTRQRIRSQMSKLLKQLSSRCSASKKHPVVLEDRFGLSTSATDEQPLQIIKESLPEIEQNEIEQVLVKDAKVQDVKDTKEEEPQSIHKAKKLEEKEECHEFEPVFNQDTKRYELSQLSTQIREQESPETVKLLQSTLHNQQLSHGDEMNRCVAEREFKRTESIKNQTLKQEDSSKSALTDKAHAMPQSSMTDKKCSLSTASSKYSTQAVKSLSPSLPERSETNLVKRASEELLKLLTDPELADELAVECAEKALQRYISPIMKEQELKVITEAEKALEEELLGLDKNIVQKLPKEVDECLSKRARAVAAAETVARGNQASEKGSMQNTLSKHSSLQSQETQLSVEFGYADMAEITKGIRSPSSEVPSSTSVPYPSKAPSLAGSQSPPERTNPSKLQQKLSRRYTSFKQVDEAELTAFYDRTYSWLKRSESKLTTARNHKEEQALRECSFKPSILHCRQNSVKRAESRETYEELETAGSDWSKHSTMDKACVRLYRKAQELHSKKYDRAEELRYEEQRSLEASSPRARPMPKGVYGEITPTAAVCRGFSSKLRPLPSGVEECTFHPKTNVKRTWTLPYSSHRSSYWNVDELRSSPLQLPDDSCEGEMSRQSSAFRTVASMETDLAEAIDSVKADASNKDTKVEQDEEHTSTERIRTTKEVKSPEDLLHVFFEQLSRNKDINSFSPSQKKEKETNTSHVKEYQSDSQALEMMKRDRNSEKHQLTQYAGDCKLMTDVDFSQFLKRQEYYLLLKNQKIQALKGKKNNRVKLSPGTLRILREKKAQLEAAKSDAGSFVRSCSSPVWDGSEETSPTKRQNYTRTGFYDKECSFSPKITKRAQRLGPRSVDDFTRKNSKAQNLIETRRHEQQVNERLQLTFKPKINNNVKATSRLNLNDPDAYMDAIRERQEQQYRKEQEAEQRREVEELSKCTFHPQIAPLPSSMKKDLQRKRRTQEDQDIDPVLPVWGYATKLQTASSS